MVADNDLAVSGSTFGRSGNLTTEGKGRRRWLVKAAAKGLSFT